MTDRYKELMDNIPGVCYQCACDEHWTMLHISAGIVALSGYSIEEIVDNKVVSYASLVHEDDWPRVDAEVLEAVNAQSVWHIEYRLRQKDGNYVWVSEQGVAVGKQDGEIILNGFIADISERKILEAALMRSEERVRELAFFDSVTGLPNRNYILDKIQEKTATIAENQNFGILYIDLDGFKSINDKHGHSAGDNVLKLTGQRMLQVVTNEDIVARIGGDEFLIFCNRHMHKDKCVDLAYNIVESISKPFCFDDRICTIGASIGIKLSDPSVSSVDSLIAAADAAMYSAKTSGTNLVYLNNYQGIDEAA